MALEEIERDKYVAMIKSAPKQLQAALLSIISSFSGSSKPISIGTCYESYHSFCAKVNLHALKQRAFSDLISELDVYGFIQIRVISKGRYGRSRDITVNLPKEVSDSLNKVILMEFDLDAVPKSRI